LIAAAAATTMVIAARQSSAARYRGLGVSDIEIRIGNTMAYSGSSAPYGEPGIAEAACFDMINHEGGVNGRNIRYLSRDDSLTATKTVELTRQLVEQARTMYLDVRQSGLRDQPFGSCLI
jgi:branched-chain amino acid transport system substrate-binding protein